MLDFSSPVFIVGFPRTGTTLLQSLLTQRGALISAPETHFFSQLLPAVEVQNGLLHLPSDGWKPLFERLHIPYTPAWAKAVAEHQGQGLSVPDAFALVFKSLAGSHDNDANTADTPTRMVEKTPDHSLRLFEIIGHFPAAKIVCTYRHPVAAIASGREVLQGYRNRSLADLAWRWRTVYSEVSRFAQQHPVCWVRYEDLVSDTDRILQRICTFCEVAYQATPQSTSRTSQILGTHETWKEEAVNAPVLAGKNNERLAGLSAGTIAEIQFHLSDWLTAYGYLTYAPRYQKIYPILRKLGFHPT
jgi:hypothetical protein